MTAIGTENAESWGLKELGLVYKEMGNVEMPGTSYIMLKTCTKPTG